MGTIGGVKRVRVHPVIRPASGLCFAVVRTGQDQFARLAPAATREQWQDRAHETNSRDCLRLPTGPCAGPRLGHPLAVSSPAGLPADGEVRIEGVRLSGHLVRAESGQEVAWVTDEPQQAPGRVWLELSHASTQTGLVPVLLADEPPLEWGRGASLDR